MVDLNATNLGGARIGGCAAGHGHIATATFDHHFDFQATLVIERRNVKIRVVDFHTSWRLNGTGSHLTCAFGAQVHHHWLIRVRGNGQPLDIEEYVGNILLHTGDGGKFVQHTVNFDAGHCGPRDGGQQGAAQRIPQGVAKAWFQWFDNKPRAGAIDWIFR